MAKEAMFHRGQKVLCNNGQVYDFGYYTDYGAVVYKEGCRNMQDSIAVKLTEIEHVEEETVEADRA